MEFGLRLLFSLGHFLSGLTIRLVSMGKNTHKTVRMIYENTTGREKKQAANKITHRLSDAEAFAESAPNLTGQTGNILLDAYFYDSRSIELLKYSVSRKHCRCSCLTD